MADGMHGTTRHDRTLWKPRRSMITKLCVIGSTYLDRCYLVPPLCACFSRNWARIGSRNDDDTFDTDQPVTYPQNLRITSTLD